MRCPDGSNFGLRGLRMPPPRLLPVVVLPLLYLALVDPYVAASNAAGLLHPQESETREIKDLCGLWRFRADYAGTGMPERWWASPLPEPTLRMPVPSSYNDLSQDRRLRDHVGAVWYELDGIFLPLRWGTQRVVLYVGSANHQATAWLNGQLLGAHTGGHLPFHLEMPREHARFGQANRLTIMVNNTLTPTSIPSGHVQTNAAGRRVQRLQMDFFNYAGLHRRVLLYTTPTVFLADVSVSSQLPSQPPSQPAAQPSSQPSSQPPPQPSDAHLDVFVSCIGAANVLLTLLDAAGVAVARGRMPATPRRGGRLVLHDPRLWWPVYMSDTPAYLYTLQLEVLLQVSSAGTDFQRRVPAALLRRRPGVGSQELRPVEQTLSATREQTSEPHTSESKVEAIY